MASSPNTGPATAAALAPPRAAFQRLQTMQVIGTHIALWELGDPARAAAASRSLASRLSHVATTASVPRTASPPPSHHYKETSAPPTLISHPRASSPPEPLRDLAPTHLFQPHSTTGIVSASSDPSATDDNNNNNNDDDDDDDESSVHSESLLPSRAQPTSSPEHQQHQQQQQSTASAEIQDTNSSSSVFQDDFIDADAASHVDSGLLGVDPATHSRAQSAPQSASRSAENSISGDVVDSTSTSDDTHRQIALLADSSGRSDRRSILSPSRTMPHLASFNADESSTMTIPNISLQGSSHDALSYKHSATTATTSHHKQAQNQQQQQQQQQHGHQSRSHTGRFGLHSTSFHIAPKEHHHASTTGPSSSAILRSHLPNSSHNSVQTGRLHGSLQHGSASAKKSATFGEYSNSGEGSGSEPYVVAYPLTEISYELSLSRISQQPVATSSNGLPFSHSKTAPIVPNAKEFDHDSQASRVHTMETSHTDLLQQMRQGASRAQLQPQQSHILPGQIQDASTTDYSNLTGSTKIGTPFSVLKVDTTLSMVAGLSPVDNLLRVWLLPPDTAPRMIVGASASTVVSMAAPEGTGNPTVANRVFTQLFPANTALSSLSNFDPLLLGSHRTMRSGIFFKTMPIIGVDTHMPDGSLVNSYTDDFPATYDSTNHKTNAVVPSKTTRNETFDTVGTNNSLSTSKNQDTTQGLSSSLMSNTLSSTIDLLQHGISSQNQTVTSTALASSSGNATNVTLGTLMKDAFRTPPLCILGGHLEQVNEIAFSSHGFIATASSDGMVRIFNVKFEECLCCLAHDSVVTSVRFHPKNEALILTGCMDGKVRLWSLESKRIVAFNEPPARFEGIGCVSFTRDGFYCVAATLSGTLHFFETEGLQYNTEVELWPGRKVNTLTKANVHKSKVIGMEALPLEQIAAKEVCKGNTIPGMDISFMQESSTGRSGRGHGSNNASFTNNGSTTGNSRRIQNGSTVGSNNANGGDDTTDVLSNPDLDYLVVMTDDLKVRIFNIADKSLQKKFKFSMGNSKTQMALGDEDQQMVVGTVKFTPFLRT